MRLRSRAAAASLFALMLSADCRRERTDEIERTESASPAAAGGTTATVSERPMAGRQEAQPFLDSAAVLLANGDTSAAVLHLHRAAALVQMAASQPRGPASDALLVIGDSIERFAGALARHERLGAMSLPRISALLNLAEADRHLSLASIACSTRSRESIYDELTMAVDHLERAAHDGQLALAAETQTAIAEVRLASAPLASDCPRDLAPPDDAIANLQPEIARMRRALQTQ